MKKSKLSLISLALCAGLMTTACENNASSSLKLGTLFPLSGDAAASGQNLPIAVRLAVNTINACGGVNGQPVEVVEGDSETDPIAAAAEMSKLIAVSEVVGVVGPYASSVAMTTIDIAVNKNVMQISPGSTSPALTERAKNGEFNGYWARTTPPDTYQAQALAQIARNRGLERVSTVVIDNEYGVGFEEVFVQSFKALGGTVINENNPVRYAPQATNLDSEALAIEAFKDNPDAILGVFYEQSGSLLLRSAHEQGLSEGVTTLLTDGVYTEPFFKDFTITQDGKSVIEGAVGTVPGASGEGLNLFRQKWEEEVGSAIPAFTPHAWDAAILMMLAAEAAGENTGTAIRDNLRDVSNAPGRAVSDPCEAMTLIRNGETINYQGASGDIELDENGDTVGSYDVWTVDAQGEVEIIDQVQPIISTP